MVVVVAVDGDDDDGNRDALAALLLVFVIVGAAAVVIMLVLILCVFLFLGSHDLIVNVVPGGWDVRSPGLQGRSLVSVNIGALIIRKGFWGTLYYNYNKEPPK